MTIETTSFCTIVTADEGNVFKNKISGDVLTNKIYLGCNDIIDNYEQINEEDARSLSEDVVFKNIEGEV